MKKKLNWRAFFRDVLRKPLLIMRWSLFLFTLSIFQAHAISGYAQKNELTLILKNSSVAEVLSEIENQSDFYFMCNRALVDLDRIVSVEIESHSVEDILEQLFKGTGVEFVVTGRQIVLKPSSGEEISQPAISVSGKVSDASGQPLPGVTVILKGTTQGTITDFEGNYSLSNVPSDATLVFSFVGMKSVEIPVSGKSNINVVLEDETIGVDEVVVVGYGTVKKSDLTGSVSSIKAEDLERVPVTGIDQALKGRAAGVQVAQNFSQPGGAISIKIRGINSIQGSTDPLYVIDGLVGANINTVNPSDIASIEILKDASSTSIYGARGANGVILVTTKSGDKGKSSITFDSYYGIQKVDNKLDLLDANDFADISNKINLALGREPFFDLSNLPASTDWQDELYQKATMQNYNLSVSGGKENLNYFVSGNFIQQEGVIPNSNYERYNLRINLDSKISEKITFGTRIGISRNKRDRLRNEYESDDHGPVSSAVLIAPTLSPYDELGNLLPEAKLDESPIPNPLHYQKNYVNFNYANEVSGSTYAKIELAKNLTFRPSINYQLQSWRQNSYKSSEIFDVQLGYRNEASINTRNSFNWHTDLILSYNNKVGDHSFDLMGGFIASKYGVESFNALVQDFALDVFEYNLLSAGANVQNVNSGKSAKQELAYIGRINYGFMGKYLATFNARYDGSSIFGIDKKWGFFPSGSIAWRLSEEPFVKDLGIFHNLKFRAGYGISGSESLPPYASLAKVASSANSGYNFGAEGVVGYLPESLAVPDLQWEETAQLDIGIDASFLKDRLSFVIDYYSKETSKLFLNVPLPKTSGVGSVTKNTGSLKNSGVELSVNTTILDGEFKWNSNFNIAFQKQEITNLGIESEIIHGNVGGSLKLGNIHIMKLGEPLGTFYGFATDGIWQESDLASLETVPTQFGTEVTPGAVKYIDNTGDGNINDDDRQIIGYALPDFFGGWNNTFSFKGFDASLFMQFTKGSSVLNANRWKLMSVSSPDLNKLVEVKDYWTPENASNTVPFLGYQEPKVVSDRLLEDGSYLRLRELTVGYSLSPSSLNKLKLSKLRLYATVTNLFTITNYTGYNPEVNNYGGSLDRFNVDNGSYPSYRTVFLGINIGL